MRASVGLSFVIVLFALANSAHAATPASDEERVAVVALDDSEGTRQAVARMGSMLAASGRHVEYADRLSETIAAHRMPRPSQETIQAFAGTSDIIADGIKAYFYQSKKQALDKLSPVLELGFNKTAALVERPDLVDQVYEAGLVLVRAHVDLGHKERANQLAATLVSHFPAKSPQLRTAPPEIIELFRQKREKLADENSRLIVQSAAPESMECTALLNGAPVGPGSHVVASNRPYYLRLDCGLRRSPMWRVTLDPGQVSKAVLILKEPLKVDLEDDSFASRRRAETHLEAVASIGGFEEVVGIKRPDVKSGPTLFAHYRDESFTWTEASDVSSVVRYTEDAFGVSSKGAAQSATEATATKETTSPGGRPDWLGWAFVGGGVAVTTAGALMFRAAVHNSKLLNCYDNVPRDPGYDCEGVSSVGLEISDEDKATETRKVRQQNAGSYVLFGLGAGAIGYGIFRLVRRPTKMAIGIDPVGRSVVLSGEF